MKNIYLIFFSVGVTSCLTNNSNCTKLSLSDEEQEWFNHYNDSELRLYRSQTNKIDTFVISVEKLQQYTLCNKFELGEYQYGHQTVSFLSKKCYELDKLNCDFTIRFTKEFQDKSNRECNKQFCLFDLESDKIMNLSDQTILIDTLKYSGKIVKSYLFELGDRVKDANAGRTYFTAFQVNKEYGLVKYETVKGDIYEYWKTL